MTDAQIERVKIFVAEGIPMRKICHGGKFHVTGFHNIAHRRSIDPVFDKLIGDYVATAYERKSAILLPPTRSVFNNAGMFAAFGDDDFRKIREMTPVGLGASERDDITQEVILALIEGRIDRAKIRHHISQFITLHYRKNGSSWFGCGRLMSLDDEMASGRVRGDTLSEGLWA